MATGDVVICSDGKLAIEIGPWAQDKLFYVQSICDIFNMGMKNKWQTRTYIDLFSGPGKCIIETSKKEIDGSPLIALSCKKPFTHYFFNDINDKLIKALEFRSEYCDFAKVKYFSKDCNLVIDDLLQRLPADSLDFCFIDPLNWEIKFDSIRKLTQSRKMDLLITFHLGSIKRDAAKPPQELIDFFPDPGWQQKYKKAREEGKLTGPVLLNAYKEGLKNIDYTYIRDSVFAKNEKNVLLYYLIFASKHQRGTYFWDEVTRRSKAGQIRMQI